MCTRKNMHKKKCVRGSLPPCVQEKMAPPLRSFSMCPTCVQMCTDVYKQKNGAAIEEFFDVYKMCTNVYRVCFLMCTRCVQMCTRKKWRHH